MPQGFSQIFYHPLLEDKSTSFPFEITSDSGKQFESDFFKSSGIKHMKAPQIIQRVIKGSVFIFTKNTQQTFKAASNGATDSHTLCYTYSFKLMPAVLLFSCEVCS